MNQTSIENYIYKNRIEERLIDCGYEINTIYEILDNLNGYISGSFILQCIKNVKYENADVDIFFPLDIDLEKYSRTYRKQFSRYSGGYETYHKYAKLEPLKNKHLDITFKGINMNAYIDYIEKVSFIVFEYENAKGHKLQLIGVVLKKYNLTNIIDFIDLTFDLDILCNCFNGKKFYIKNIDNINKNKAVINTTKTKTMVLGNERLLRIYRLIKYLNRSYDITLNTSFGNFHLFKKDNNDLYFYDKENCSCLIYVFESNPKILYNLDFDITKLYLVIKIAEYGLYSHDTIDTNFFTNLPPSVTEIYIAESKEQYISSKMYKILEDNTNILPFGCSIGKFDSTELPLIFKNVHDCADNGNYKETHKFLVNESFNEKIARAKNDVKEFVS